MTGAEIKALRELFGASVRRFAPLVGVQEATVWRWESYRDVARQIGPHSTAILTLLEAYAMRGPVAERLAFVADMRDALRDPDGLHALQVLLFHRAVRKTRGF